MYLVDLCTLIIECFDLELIKRKKIASMTKVYLALLAILSLLWSKRCQFSRISNFRDAVFDKVKNEDWGNMATLFIVLHSQYLKSLWLILRRLRINQENTIPVLLTHSNNIQVSGVGGGYLWGWFTAEPIVKKKLCWGTGSGLNTVWILGITKITLIGSLATQLWYSPPRYSRYNPLSKTEKDSLCIFHPCILKFTLHQTKSFQMILHLILGTFFFFLNFVHLSFKVNIYLAQ